MRKLEKKRVNKSLLISLELHSRLEEARDKFGLRDFTQLLNYFLSIDKKN